jgi:hypothetical protein
MQTIIVFDMPDDEQLLQEYIRSPAWQAAASAFDQWLRSKIKYQENTEEVQAVYEEVRQKWGNILEIDGLSSG